MNEVKRLNPPIAARLELVTQDNNQAGWKARAYPTDQPDRRPRGSCQRR